MGTVTGDDLAKTADGPSAPSYRPLVRARLSDRVADAILGSISARSLVPGDRLPTEKQLCEQFAVSRTVVREAMQSLEAKGVVRGGTKTGLRVVAVDAEHISTSMVLFIRGRPDLSYEEVSEVRATIEIAIAGLAAQRATTADVERLSGAAAEVDRAAGSENEPEADVAFHRVIADAAHNELYLVMLDSIAQVLVDSRRLSQSVPGEAGHNTRSHQPILDAIRAHDPERARSEMSRHLRMADSTYWRHLATEDGRQHDS